MATVAGVFAGVLIYLLGVALWSRRVALILTMLVCAQPMAVSLVMGYTEGLFLALVAGTFIAAYQRVWWLAGLLGTAAALTRPTGIAVALGLTVAVWLLWLARRRDLAASASAFPAAPAVAAVPASLSASASASAHPPALPAAWSFPATPFSPAASASPPASGSPAAAPDAGEGRWFAGRKPVRRREVLGAALAAAASLVAGPLFLAWVGWRVGEWDAWFKVQTAGWGSTFDWGTSVVLFIYDTLRGGTGMVEMVTAWLIIAAIAFCFVAAFDRVWPPLLVFGMVSLILVVGQAGYWHSKPRLLVPVMLLASVPVAHALARASTRAATALLVLWSAFGLWFGAYMITIWPFTI